MKPVLMALFFVLTINNSLTFPTLPDQGLPVNGETVGELLQFGSGLTDGLLLLLSEKIALFTRLLDDKDFLDSLGNTVSAGAKITEEVARVAIPATKQILPAIPTIIEQGSILVASLATLVGRAGPVVLQGASQLADLGPLVTGTIKTSSVTVDGN